MMQQELICYKQLPIWNHDSIPQGFKKQHNTQVGTWAKLTILKGEMLFSMLHESGEVQSEHVFSVQNQPPFIEPQAWHKIVSASEDIECQLSFYCLAQDYFVKKYKLSPTHSEIIAALPQLPVGKALDVGCGTGRNALYLSQHGFQVDAWDGNPTSIQKLNEIIEAEQITTIQTAVRDLNQDSSISGQYHFINCTVVMMFLAPETTPKLIQNMQKATLSQGYNLIVCAMDTEDYPVQQDFPSSFKAGELSACYADWDIVKYNENVGELHRTDAAGDRIKQRFATLLVRKK